MTGAAPRPSRAPPTAPVISPRWPAPMASSNSRPGPTSFQKVSSRGSSAGSAMDRTQEKVVSLASLTQGRVLDTLRRPIHDLRISVMDRCNFRCPYCMPRETFHDAYRFLKSSERLTFDEITRVARIAATLGVSKLRLTGGEPLLRTGLPDLVGELSSIDGIDDLALTTNGVLLAQQAARLKANGLGRVTVSLDTLDERVFAAMSGGFGGAAQVLDGIEAALAAGLAPVKVNAVV